MDGLLSDYLLLIFGTSFNRSLSMNLGALWLALGRCGSATLEQTLSSASGSSQLISVPCMDNCLRYDTLGQGR